jgi:hypothetical protein
VLGVPEPRTQATRRAPRESSARGAGPAPRQENGEASLATGAPRPHNGAPAHVSPPILSLGGASAGHRGQRRVRLAGVKRRTPKVRAVDKGRPRVAAASTAAAKSEAAERARIRRMSALERVLLALDLGERFSTFAKSRP